VTFLELYGEGLDRELSSSDRTALFTTARRKSAINAGQLEFAKQTNCYVRWLDITIDDGQREYDVDSLAVVSGGDFIDFAPEGAEYIYTDSDGNDTYTSGDDFLRRDVGWLNRSEPGWRNTAAAESPMAWYAREVDGHTYIGLHPLPSVASGTSAILRLPYVAMPPDMSGDANEPFAVSAGSDSKVRLRPWHQALVHYAAALLEPLRKNYQGEQRQRALFASQVSDYLSKQRVKGGREIQVARNYYAETRRRSAFWRREDPFR
jgi:hypothetical protein